MKNLFFSKYHFLIYASIVAACGVANLDPEERAKNNLDNGGYNTFSAQDLRQFKVPTKWGFSDTAETVAALAGTSFSKVHTAKVLMNGAVIPGVLPQVLATSVRTEISTNGAIRFMRDMPLGESLLSEFANDKNMAAEVRNSLAAMFKKGLANYGGTSLPQRVLFNFDHFVPSSAGRNSFDVLDQAAKWNLVWATDGLFAGKSPIDGIDHGLQLLHVLRTLSEWAYLFGLDSSGEPSPFGGLTKRWEDNQLIVAKPLKTSDPSFSKQLVSGRYSVRVPGNLPAVDLATRGGERWETVIQPVSLIEQATMWLSAANAFARLRSDQRGNTYNLYSGSDPVLGQSIDLLPLVFLANMAQMLDGPFIDVDNQRIFAIACPDKNCELADTRTLARLTMALARWVEATKNIENVRMDADAKKKIIEAQPSLKKALQFTSRALMGGMTEVKALGDRRWTRVVIPRGKESEGAAISAEVVGTLAYIERRILNSELMRERVRILANGHAASYFFSNEATKSGETILWNARMVRELNRSKFVAILPWLAPVTDSFKTAMGQEWEEP